MIQKAVELINKSGILLVYPIKNQRDPPSLWYKLHPRTEMNWDWSEDGDARVADLWHLRTELSRSQKVVYAKWFRGRATFFSHDVYSAMQCLMNVKQREQQLKGIEKELYESLLEDSPQSPRILRAQLGLEGRLNETPFNRAQRILWQNMLMVGFGEIEDGAFPSLAIGASRHLHEETWEKALAMTTARAKEILEKPFARCEVFSKFFSRLCK